MPLDEVQRLLGCVDTPERLQHEERFEYRERRQLCVLRCEMFKKEKRKRREEEEVTVMKESSY